MGLLRAIIYFAPWHKLAPFIRPICLLLAASSTFTANPHQVLQNLSRNRAT